MEKANVHLPNNNKHEHFFVHLSLIDINDAKTLDHNYIIIESDNCKAQHKSCVHFWSI